MPRNNPNRKNKNALTASAAVKTRVARVIERSLSAHSIMLDSWRSDINDIWDRGDPAAVLVELGINASTILERLEVAAEYLEFVENGCTTNWQAKILPYTLNLDGTATLV